MSDQITVRFGGREVVLKRNKSSDSAWGADDGPSFRLEVQQFKGEDGYRGLVIVVTPALTIGAKGDTAQAAVSAVESKLRQLRDELDKVLGPRGK